MAQTKTKSKTKTKPKTSSSKRKGGQQSSRSRPKKARTTSSKSIKSGSKQRRKPTQSSRPGSTSGSSNSVGSPLDKLKGPATATGAALLGGAGGLAATRAHNGNGRRRKLVKSLKRIDLPSADAVIDWVEKRATNVGDAADKAEQ